MIKIAKILVLFYCLNTNGECFDVIHFILAVPIMDKEKRPYTQRGQLKHKKKKK
jgi:hypothetical protein